jgi:hypothetical protein
VPSKMTWLWSLCDGSLKAAAPRVDDGGEWQTQRGTEAAMPMRLVVIK